MDVVKVRFKPRLVLFSACNVLKAFHLECLRSPYICPICSRFIKDDLTTIEQEEQIKRQKRSLTVPFHIICAWFTPLILALSLTVLHFLWPSMRMTIFHQPLSSGSSNYDKEELVPVPIFPQDQAAVVEWQELNRRYAELNRQFQQAGESYALGSALLETGAPDLANDVLKRVGNDLSSIKKEMQDINARKTALSNRVQLIEGKDYSPSLSPRFFWFTSIGIALLLLFVWLVGLTASVVGMIKAARIHSLKYATHAFLGFVLSFVVIWMSIWLW